MDYLLEIGTEELPARLTGGLLEQLQQAGEKLLTEQRIGFDKVESFATPRRLVLYISGIAPEQAEMVEEVKGPSKKAGFDAEGNPTRAAQGFARGQGVAITDLVVKITPSGDYLFASKRLQGRPTAEVLSDQLVGLITGLVFPRPMRWGDRELKFIRPIHWLISLLGLEVIDFELDTLHPGRVTYGLRNFDNGPVEIATPEEYFDKLSAVKVLVDHHQRQKQIWKMTQQMAAAVRGEVHPDEELLEEITHLVEYPTPLCGGFDTRFLKLPPEVVITPMREHQRYFPVWSDKGKLLAKFIAFANGPVSDRKLVTEGNEKVLRARLQDAEFFYQEDLKTALSEKVEKLKKIVFMEGMGTIYEKVERITSLTCYLAAALKLTSNQQTVAKRAAQLCKADLVTSMVCEFPELQGVMGGYYALVDKEKKEVAQAIREHYQPRFAGDQPPASKPGAVVAIADKLDNLVASFALGQEPSGSQDPFALRRQALGICNIVLTCNFDFSLSELIAQAYAGFSGAGIKVELPVVSDHLNEFFRARLRNLFIDRGYSYDIVEAVLTPSNDDLSSVQRRLEAVLALRDRPEFESLLTAYTRASNLGRKAEVTEIDPVLVTEDAELQLYQVWVGIKKEMLRLEKKGEIKDALLQGAALVAPLDTFFTGVMVMVDDPAVRNNRLALLKDIAETIGAFGDLSKIVK